MPGKSKLKKIYSDKVKEILKEEGKSLEEYGTILIPLNEINNMAMKLLTRQANGQRPKLTKDVVEKLREQYSKLISACDKYVKDGLPESASVQMTSELLEIARAESIALNTATEKNNFQDVLDAANHLDITIQSEKLQTSGANLSTRIPVEYKDSEGKTVSGYFTPRKDLNYDKSIVKAIDNLKGSNEQVAGMIRKVYSDIVNEKRNNRDDDFDDGLLAEDFMQEIDSKIGAIGRPKDALFHMSRIGAELYKRYTKNDSAPGIGENEFIEAATPFLKEYANILKDYHFYSRLQHLHTDVNIDKMNSAMSDVAKLLGVEKVICKADNMTVTVNGEKIHGTFMEKANGLDIESLPKEHAFYKLGVSEKTSAEGIMDLYNIQVLDYICGNMDRHTGNLVYQFDDEGNFKGVQGIDNDCAFGTAEFGTLSSQIAVPANMGILPKSTADKIMLMDNNVLKSVLKARELNDEQIDAAIGRLEEVKKAVTDGVIAVKPDDFFKDKNLKSALEEFKSHKYIDKLSSGFNRIDEKVRHGKFGEGATYNKAEVESVNTPLENQNILKGIKAEVNKLGWNMFPSSQDTVNMKTAAAALEDVVKRYQDKPLDEEGARDLAGALKNVRKYAQAYINKKADKKSLRFYEKNRLAFAKGLEKFVSKHLPNVESVLEDIDDRRQRDYDYIADVAADTVTKVNKLDEFAKGLEGNAKQVGDMVKEINKLVKDNAPDDPSNHYAKTLLRDAFKQFSKGKNIEESGLGQKDLEDTMETIKKGRIAMGQSATKEDMNKEREELAPHIKAVEKKQPGMMMK